MLDNSNNKQWKVRKSAKSVDSAIKLALDELGISVGEADITIISSGSRGFLGIGAKEACVEVQKKDSGAKAAAEEKPAEPAAPKQDEKKADEEPAADSESLKKETKQQAAVLTEEEMETAKEVALTFIEDLLSAMKVTAQMDCAFEEGTLMISLTSRELGVVIGKRGETLDAVQYLVSLVVNKTTPKYIRVSVDAENYRAKRQDALVNLAQKLAKKVNASKRKYTLEPMSPYERRIIHAALQDNPYVTTYSVGEEPYRKVVIVPKR